MNNRKYLLPYGDALREFLNQSGITRADLKNILRRRGVFFSNDEKKNTIPIIIKTGISPSELEELRDKVKEKEDNPKVITQSIPWVGDKNTLVESVQNDLSAQDIINEPFSNYKIIGAPNFKPINGDRDHIEMEFRIERYDLTKSWDKNISQFGGKITLKKDSSGLNINMKLVHTSPETKTIAQKVTRRVIRNLKDDGYVDSNSNIKKIRFNDFNNENRVAFLQELLRNQLETSLYFKDTENIGFRPDGSVVLPKNISWMEEKIKNLVLQGKKLHNTFFIKDITYHQYLEVYKIEGKYSFEIDECEGSCNISLQFADFISKNKNDAELMINVEKLKFTKRSTSIPSNKLKELLLSFLETRKLALHGKYSKNEVK